MRFSSLVTLWVAIALSSSASGSLPTSQRDTGLRAPVSHALLVIGDRPVCVASIENHPELVAKVDHAKAMAGEGVQRFPACDGEQVAQLSNVLVAGLSQQKVAAFPAIIVPAVLCIGAAFATTMATELAVGNSSSIESFGAAVTVGILAMSFSRFSQVAGVCSAVGGVIGVILYYRPPDPPHATQRMAQPGHFNQGRSAR